MFEQSYIYTYKFNRTETQIYDHFTKDFHFRECIRLYFPVCWKNFQRIRFILSQYFNFSLLIVPREIKDKKCIRKCITFENVNIITLIKRLYPFPSPYNYLIMVLNNFRKNIVGKEKIN